MGNYSPALIAGLMILEPSVATAAACRLESATFQPKYAAQTSASCGPRGPRQRKVDPVFRFERCASQERKHRINPKSASPLLGPML